MFGPIAASDFNSASIFVTPFQDLLVTRIKTPGGKDLFVNVSMETGIFAISDLTNNSGLAVTLAQPNTQLQVRVLIDCPDCAHPYTARPAKPGIVNFDNLVRSVQRVTISPPATVDEFGDRVSQLGVRTFAFVAEDVDVGIHTVRVQARFLAASTSLSFNGRTQDQVQAHIGARTVTVEEVKLDAQ